MLSEAKAGSTGKVTISSARLISSLSRPNRSRPNRMPVRCAGDVACPQHPRRLDRPAHRLEAVALARRRGKDEVEIGDRRCADRRTPRRASITWSARLAAARALSFGQPSRGSTSRNSRQAEIRHGARHHADILAQLRLDEDDDRAGDCRLLRSCPSRPSRRFAAAARPCHSCRANESEECRDGRRTGRPHPRDHRRSIRMAARSACSAASASRSTATCWSAR